MTRGVDEASGWTGWGARNPHHRLRLAVPVFAVCAVIGLAACAKASEQSGTDSGRTMFDGTETTVEPPANDGRRVLGTYSVSLWERDAPYDALADAEQAADVPQFFAAALNRACRSEDTEDSFVAGGLVSVVASMYSGVPSDDPNAQDFIDEFGFAVDEEMRRRALDTVDCVETDLGGSKGDLFGEYTEDLLRELNVVRNLLTGSPG